MVAPAAVTHALGMQHANASSSSAASAAASTTTEVSSSLDTEDTAIPALDSFPPTGTPKHQKLGGYDFYRSIGSPKRVVAPMVDGSELPWRILSRRHGADLCYSPMINSKIYGGTSRGKARPIFRDHNFCKSTGEEGAADLQVEGHEAKDTDRPLFVQFCGNDPALLLESALDLQDHCDAIDLNLGCPQNIAKKGHYGAFLQEDWPLIFSLINTLHLELKIPVTAKMRVFPSVERTVAYARMLERAGAQIIAVHGRTREMKGHRTGLADWQKIAAVKRAVSVPVFANGNILYPQDITDALRVTGADGVMSAEGNLYNPAVFADKQGSAGPTSSPVAGPSKLPLVNPTPQFPYVLDICNEYLDLVAALKMPPTHGAPCKSHLFKLLRPVLEIHPEFRRQIGPARLDPEAEGEERVQEYRAILRAIDVKLREDMQKEEYLVAPKVLARGSYSQLREDGTPDPNADAVTPEQAFNEPNRPAHIPHWLLQPYFRPPMPPQELAKQAQAKEAKTKRAANGRPIEIRDVQARAEEAAALDESGSADGATKRKADAGDAADIGSKEKGLEHAEKKVKDMIEEAQKLKAAANEKFSKGRWEEAVAIYDDAIAVLPPRGAAPGRGEATERDDSPYPDPIGNKNSDQAAGDKEDEEELSEEEKEVKMLRAALYGNMAACHLKLEQWKETVRACTEALQDDPSYVKALHRRATANEKMGGWTGVSNAMEDYTALLRLFDTPDSLKPSIRKRLAELEPEAKRLGEKEKDEMLGKLKGIGNSILGHFGLSTDNFQFTPQSGGGYSMNFVR